MALTTLPPELLEIIIRHALPEGFEALALSCKAIFAVCAPFIARHNELRRQYTNFVHDYTSLSVEHEIWTAFDLIARIASEPVIARYIQDADFGRDSLYSMERGHRRPALETDIEDVKYGGIVAELLAASSYLQQAGIDWETYWAEMKRELMDRRDPYQRHYSQHAATFLLTLLPNVKSVFLPRLWQPNETSNRLLDAIARAARKSTPNCKSTALASTTRFHGESKQSNLRWTYPVIALPYLDSVVVCGSVTIGSSIPHPETFANKLTDATLSLCDIDESGIFSFLRRTPSLRRLTYSHNTGGRLVGSFYSARRNPRDWNISAFVTAIGREVGEHLEELFISIKELCGDITPGKVSMDNFHRLRHLRIPFELAQCNIDATSQVEGEDWESEEWHVTSIVTADLVPDTVQILSVPPPRTKSEHNALESIVRGLRRRSGSEPPPVLQAIYVCSHGDTCTIVSDEEQVLRTEAEKAGVALHVGLNENANLARALDRSNTTASSSN